ncbi:MAG: hypothetical protein NVSMB64_23490 [Candidatus Velthaea sp.]
MKTEAFAAVLAAVDRIEAIGGTIVIVAGILALWHAKANGRFLTTITPREGFPRSLYVPFFVPRGREYAYYVGLTRVVGLGFTLVGVALFASALR